jgi:hypothetical protein
MPAAKSRRTPLLILAAAITWWITLGLMAALTSNPSVLNITQILESRLIIEAREASGGDTVEVIQVYAADRLEPPSATLKITNLSDVLDTLRSNASCLMPLSPDGEGRWRVSGWRFVDKGQKNSTAVIYPATPTTRTRLKQILEQAKRQILDRPIKLDRHFVQMSRSLTN